MVYNGIKLLGENTLDILVNGLNLGANISLRTLIYAIPILIIFIYLYNKIYFKLVPEKNASRKILGIILLTFALMAFNYVLAYLVDYVFSVINLNSKYAILFYAGSSLAMCIFYMLLTSLVSKVIRSICSKKNRKNKKISIVVMPFLGVGCFWIYNYIIFIFNIDLKEAYESWSFDLLSYIIAVIAIVIPFYMLMIRRNIYSEIIYLNNNKLPIRLKAMQNEIIELSDRYRILYFHENGKLKKEDIILKENVYKKSKFYK